MRLGRSGPAGEVHLSRWAKACTHLLDIVLGRAAARCKPRPACGERLRPPSAAVLKNAEAKLRLRCIVRCNPGEGVPVQYSHQSGVCPSVCPSPNPLPARTGRGSAPRSPKERTQLPKMCACLSPLGEVDLRSKSGEGLRSIDLPRPLTRRYAPTSLRRGEVGHHPRSVQKSSRSSRPRRCRELRTWTDPSARAVTSV